jgi:hypothetical protein
VTSRDARAQGVNQKRPTELDDDAPCPCGSGVPNASCHRVHRINRLIPVSAPGMRESIAARIWATLTSPPAYSTGQAEACPGCGRILLVGFADEVLLIRGVIECLNCGTLSVRRAVVTPGTDS